MSLLTRRIIFYLLLGLFVIIAPLLIGYTTGYRYSFKQHRLVKTGALAIESIPNGANVILNGKNYRDRTTTLITDIIPGNYQITLERDGYYSWQKTLTVESEKTTFAYGVPLFKKTVPELIQGESVPNTSETESPDIQLPQDFKQFKIFYDKKLELIVIIDNEKQQRLADLPGNRAIWRIKPFPLLFVFSAHELWQYDPKSNERILITRLVEDIQDIIAPDELNAILLISKNYVQALELDLRDQQNIWTLAEFDNIKNATLMDDGKTLQILGIYKGKEGVWELKLQ